MDIHTNYPRLKNDESGKREPLEINWDRQR